MVSLPREPKGRGAAWTEERGTSDRARRRRRPASPAAAGGHANRAAPRSGPEASGNTDRPRRGFRRVRHRLGAAHLGRGRPGLVCLLPAGRRLAAGGARPGAARRRADRAEPAGLVRVRAGVRPRAVRAPAVLAGQRGLVRVVRAGRGPGGHLRGARHRPAAAAPPALLAGRGGGLVGMRRGGAGPVALRLSLGPAGDEPVGRAGRALGRGGRRAAAHLPGRPDRRHDRAGGARAAGPGTPGFLAVPEVLGSSPGRGGDGGAGPRGRPAAGRPDRGRADGPGGRDPGRRAAGQEPAAAS